MFVFRFLSIYFHKEQHCFISIYYNLTGIYFFAPQLLQLLFIELELLKLHNLTKIIQKQLIDLRPADVNLRLGRCKQLMLVDIQEQFD